MRVRFFTAQIARRKVMRDTAGAKILEGVEACNSVARKRRDEKETEGRFIG